MLRDMTQWLDIALAFDPATRRVDLMLADDGDMVLDETPATPMIISFGTDRRARPDDDLPGGITELNAPASFVDRRGWAGDALDSKGERIGCRLWLLDRAKQSDLTRLMAEEWTKEAYAWVLDDTASAAEIEVAWQRKEVLGIRVQIDGHSYAVNRPVT